VTPSGRRERQFVDDLATDGIDGVAGLVGRAQAGVHIAPHIRAQPEDDRGRFAGDGERDLAQRAVESPFLEVGAGGGVALEFLRSQAGKLAHEPREGGRIGRQGAGTGGSLAALDNLPIPLGLAPVSSWRVDEPAQVAGHRVGLDG